MRPKFHGVLGRRIITLGLGILSIAVLLGVPSLQYVTLAEANSEAIDVHEQSQEQGPAPEGDASADTASDTANLGQVEEAGTGVGNSTVGQDPPQTKLIPVSITELIELALEYNYDLRIKQKEAKSAFFEYLRIKGEAGLSLDLTSGITRSGPLVRFRFDPTGPETTFQKEVATRTSLRLTYPIAPLGNLGYGEKAAEALYLSTQSQVDKEVSSTIVSTFESYTNYLTAEEAVALAEEGLALAEEQLRNATLRFEEGIAPRFEVIQGEVAVSEAKEELIDARNNLALAESSLYLTVGVDPSVYFEDGKTQITYEDWLGKVVEDIAGQVLPCLDAEEIAEDFIEWTPDYRSLRSSIISLEYQIKGRRRSPLFSISAGYTYQTGSSFQKKFTWDYGISGTLNLFDSEKTESLQRSLSAQKERAEIQLEKYKQAFKLSVKNKLTQLQGAVLGWETSKATLRQAEEGLRMSRLGYEEGVVTHADLVSSRTAYLSAGLREFRGRLEVISAYQALLKEIGMTDPNLYLPKSASDFYWMDNFLKENNSEQDS